MGKTHKVCAWQRPTLPGPCGPSTIGAGRLNGRVRDGYAWDPSAIATKRITERNIALSKLTTSEEIFMESLFHKSYLDSC